MQDFRFLCSPAHNEPRRREVVVNRIIFYELIPFYDRRCAMCDAFFNVFHHPGDKKSEKSRHDNKKIVFVRDESRVERKNFMTQLRKAWSVSLTIL